jgi:hypothetical protein
LALLEARASARRPYTHAPSAQASQEGCEEEKGVKAEPKIKAEKEVKTEKGIKVEPSSKRPRPISREVSTLKRFTVTRQRAKELGEGLLEEEDLEDLVPFEEILKD